MSNTITAALEPIDTFADYPEAISSLHFELPQELEAGEPPEARGLRRDEVRLMVSYLDDDSVVHSRFAGTSPSSSEPATPSSSTPAAP